jgi:hypothetical protein
VKGVEDLRVVKGHGRINSRLRMVVRYVVRTTKPRGGLVGGAINTISLIVYWMDERVHIRILVNAQPEVVRVLGVVKSQLFGIIGRRIGGITITVMKGITNGRKTNGKGIRFII